MNELLSHVRIAPGCSACSFSRSSLLLPPDWCTGCGAGDAAELHDHSGGAGGPAAGHCGPAGAARAGGGEDQTHPAGKPCPLHHPIFAHPHLHSSIQLLSHPSIHPVPHPSTQLLIHTPSHSFIHFIPPSFRSLIHLSIRPFMRSWFHPFMHVRFHCSFNTWVTQGLGTNSPQAASCMLL